MSNLLNFYGLECPHCDRMHVLVEKLEKEIGVKFDAFEVWHNDENAKKLESLDIGGECEVCGGVPFLYNTKTKKSICGEVPYDELKAWALE